MENLRLPASNPASDSAIIPLGGQALVPGAVEGFLPVLKRLTPLTLGDSSKIPPQTVKRLITKAQAALPFLQAKFPEERFTQGLLSSLENHFRGANPSPGDVAAYLESLHVAALALSCACIEGDESAWEYFITEFRPILYAAARAITGSDSSGRDLADSLYADLYGLDRRSDESGADRRSLLSYFHGRSKLTTWLRAVLAQRYVDGLRAARRSESLEDENPASATALETSAPWKPPDPDRPRYLALLQTALTSALGALEPRDLFRLSCYYVQEMTLAQIGRLLHEHEATVSRKLGRTRTHLRHEVERSLRDAKGLTPAEINLCYEYATQEWPFDLTRVLTAAQADKGG